MRQALQQQQADRPCYPVPRHHLGPHSPSMHKLPACTRLSDSSMRVKSNSAALCAQGPTCFKSPPSTHRLHACTKRSGSSTWHNRSALFPSTTLCAHHPACRCCMHAPSSLTAACQSTLIPCSHAPPCLHPPPPSVHKLLQAPGNAQQHTDQPCCVCHCAPATTLIPSAKHAQASDMHQALQSSTWIDNIALSPSNHLAFNPHQASTQSHAYDNHTRRQQQICLKRFPCARQPPYTPSTTKHALPACTNLALKLSNSSTRARRAALPPEPPCLHPPPSMRTKKLVHAPNPLLMQLHTLKLKLHDTQAGHAAHSPYSQLLH